jgi:phage-related protein
MGKPLIFLAGEIRTPPMSASVRRKAGYLLRILQQGESLGMPESRPMPSIGRRCYELRVSDARETWRIIYRLDEEALLIIETFKKKTPRTPVAVLRVCRKRLTVYDQL